MVINNEEFFARVLEQLEAGHTVTIPVKGFSMLPFIRGTKDLVVLEKKEAPVKRDDIVLVRYRGRYVLHRVISVDGDKVEIQGDGIYSGKEYPPLEDIYAKVITILRAGKREVDPYSGKQLSMVHAWQSLGTLRRYILFIYRHLPWNVKWIKNNIV